MSDRHAPSNARAYAQADARALLKIFKPSNARTYVRTNRELLTFILKVTEGDARRGGQENWPEVGERWPVLRTAKTQRRRDIPQSDRIYIYVRDGFYCCFCGRSGKDWARERVQLVPDHVVPWSAMGSDHVNNLRTLCWDCNEQRSNIRTERDADWNPLPVTYECVRCCPDIPRDDPSVDLAFCYNCRTRALGIVTDWNQFDA